MDLHRKKLWLDRLVWLVVVAATGVIVYQYIDKDGAAFQRYLFYSWTVFVLALLASELRIGRRQPETTSQALHTGWAKLVE